MSALAVIIEVQKSTEIFLDWEFEYLSNYLRYNIVSQSPHIRNQIQNLYKKALDRFNAGLKFIERHVGILKKKMLIVEKTNETSSNLQIYEKLEHSYMTFIKYFTKQLISYLSIDSNYPRRVVSLDLLTDIHSFMVPDEWLACWTENDVKNCHNILFDGYENNKKMAVRLLEHLPPNFVGFSVSLSIYSEAS